MYILIRISILNVFSSKLNLNILERKIKNKIKTSLTNKNIKCVYGQY